MGNNGGSKAMLIVMIAVMVVLVGVVVGALLYIINLVGKTGGGDSEATPPPATTASHVPREQIHPYKLADPISVNLLDSPDGSKHVLRVAIAIGVNGTDAKVYEPLMETISANDVVIRDAAIGILRNKTLEDIRQVDGQDAVKAELLAKLQDLFETDLIIEVTTGEFYYQ